MRALRLSLAALAFGTVLAGCGGAKSGALAPLKTTPAEAEAYIAKLSTEAFKGEATAAADIASVRDALPREVALTWESLTFDAATGSTVLTGVRLTPADMPTIGLGIAEVRLWDFDAAFAKARLSGQRLTETASLARRIEAKTISVFGLETLIAPITEQATSAVTDAITDPLAATDPALAAQMRASMEMKLDSYEFSLGRLVFDDVMLRPYELTPAVLPADSEFAEVMPFLQGYAAAARTFAADTMAASDFTARLAMTQMGQATAINVGAESYGARGMRGGDTDVAFMRDMKLDMTVPNPENPSAPPMAISGGIDLYTFEGVRGDKLLAYLGKGEWPPRTDTDLLSLGKLVTKGERIALNGHNLYSVVESSFDARDWYWFIPTRLRMSATDVVYDVDAIMAFVTEIGANVSVSVDQPEGTPAAPVAMPNFDPRIMAALARAGLNKPSMDYALGWNWNPQSGATTIDGAFGLDNYLRFDLKLDGGMPAFKAVSDLIPGGPETANETEIGKLFATALRLKSFEANIIDEGGLDKAFNLAVEIGKLMPVEPGAPDFFATQTPQTLRQMAVAGVYMLADQAGSELPAARDLLAPLATFVEKGGKVRITMKPKQALTASGVEAGFATATPAAMLQQLNLKVQHTPPAK